MYTIDEIFRVGKSGNTHNYILIWPYCNLALLKMGVVEKQIIMYMYVTVHHYQGSKLTHARKSETSKIRVGLANILRH